MIFWTLLLALTGLLIADPFLGNWSLDAAKSLYKTVSKDRTGKTVTNIGIYSRVR